MECAHSEIYIIICLFFVVYNVVGGQQAAIFDLETEAQWV